MDLAYLNEKVVFFYSGNLLHTAHPKETIADPFSEKFKKTLSYLEPIISKYESDLKLNTGFSELSYKSNLLELSALGNFKKVFSFVDELLLSSEPGYEIIMPQAITTARNYHKNLIKEKKKILESEETTKLVFDYIKKTLYSRGFEMKEQGYGMRYYNIFRSNDAYQILHPKKN